MILHIVKARYIDGYRIGVLFNDGNSGVVDLDDADLFNGPIFKPLKELSFFKDFIVDPELNTLVWKNGADLAPEYIASRLLVKHRQ